MSKWCYALKLIYIQKYFESMSDTIPKNNSIGLKCMLGNRESSRQKLGEISIASLVEVVDYFIVALFFHATPKAQSTQFRKLKIGIKSKYEASVQ